MTGFDEAKITRAIIHAFHEKLSDRIVSDVAIVGAGPSGLTAAIYLAEKGVKVTLLEKRLAPGGGIWGGGMTMNEAVVQEAALPILRKAGVRARRHEGDLYVVDAVELASALTLKALHAGAVLLNVMTVEDVCVHDGRVDGVVVNLTTVSGALHVDPLAFSAKVVLDATGHDAAVVQALRKRGLLRQSEAGRTPGEGPMDAPAGEAFVVDHVAEVYPGLWVTGMGVSATFGGPRMGPIFGGMLLSGRRAAELIRAALKPPRKGAGR